MSKIQENGYGGETLKAALFSEYSDTYKDAAGFRPRLSREAYDALTEDDLRVMIAREREMVALELRWEREAEEARKADKAAHEAALAHYQDLNAVFPPNNPLAEALASVQETGLEWGDFEAAEWGENGQPRSEFDALVFIG